MNTCRLNYLIFFLSTSFCVNAEQSVSSYKEFTAYVADNLKCSNAISVTIKSSIPEDFMGKRNNLNKLVAGLGSSLANSCSVLKSIRITGKVAGKIIYNGIASTKTEWELIDELSSNIFSSANPTNNILIKNPSNSQKPNTNKKDAFSLFETPSTNQKTPKRTAVTEIKKKTASTPKLTNTKTMSIYCSGKAQQYTGPMKTFSNNFEFRTILNFSKKSHQVVNVLSGKLFQSGATYEMLELPNDIVVLNAESTDKKWIIPTLRLDLSVSKISGEGTVNLGGLRSRIMPRLLKSIPSMRGKTPDGGLDSARKVVIQGACVKA